MFKMSPVTISFDETPEASTLYWKTPFSPREVNRGRWDIKRILLSYSFKIDLVN
jgi:hypothetical protein